MPAISKVRHRYSKQTESHQGMGAKRGIRISGLRNFT